jgi:4-methoxybenzoate monooxygenase (O-demethylating)
MPHAFAVSDIDPFCDAFLADPYPFHERLREAGAVVWLERYGIWASARHAEVQAALTDWQTFSSAAGVGIDDFRRSKPWRPPSLILEADPPLHTRSRAVMNRALSAKAMAGLRASFKEAAERLADALVARRRVDAIADIAEAYPLSVFPKAVGLGPDGLDNLLPYGAMVFNAFGPRNKRFEEAMAEAAKVVGWINAQCAREALSPDGIGAAIWAAVDTGEVSREEAPVLVRSVLSAGLDTTIIGLGNGLYAFAANPAQWQALRDNPALLRPAFDEILRFESPVQTFFRTTTKPVELGGVALRQDAKILLFLSAANRDPRRWEEPEHFDISRRATGHVAFGAGIHMCVGQMLARLESEMMLGALAARFSHIAIAGEPRRKLNNSLRQFASLPIALTPA